MHSTAVAAAAVRRTSAVSWLGRAARKRARETSASRVGGRGARASHARTAAVAVRRLKRGRRPETAHVSYANLLGRRAAAAVVGSAAAAATIVEVVFHAPSAFTVCATTSAGSGCCGSLGVGCSDGGSSALAEDEVEFRSGEESIGMDISPFYPSIFFLSFLPSSYLSLSRSFFSLLYICICQTRTFAPRPQAGPQHAPPLMVRVSQPQGP